MKFKVGDVVWYEGSSYINYEDCGLYIIRDIGDGEHWNGGQYVSFTTEPQSTAHAITCIKHVKVKSTELSRFIHPEWEEKDGWLYPKVS